VVEVALAALVQLEPAVWAVEVAQAASVVEVAVGVAQAASGLVVRRRLRRTRRRRRHAAFLTGRMATCPANTALDPRTQASASALQQR